MDHCQACMPVELHYQIRIDGDENSIHLDSIEKHLNSKSMLIRRKQNILTVKESAVIGLYDYFTDMMNVNTIFFKIGDTEWKPIEAVRELVEYQWIDKVIFDGKINFHIQPIVTADKSIYAYEMLARFQDEKGDPLGPFPVFSAAKKRNRTYALDRVCRMSAVKSAALVDHKVFINFIPTSIYSPEHCLRSTVTLANELGIEPSRFVFEVVESEKVNDIEHLKKVLNYYKEKGFHYALDDVGEGFSTIEVLEELAPHYMKLDMKYVHGVKNDFLKQKAALKILHAALQVGAIPLAEGVELEEDFLWLKEKGFQLFQGYLFGRPAPIPTQKPA